MCLRTAACDSVHTLSVICAVEFDMDVGRDKDGEVLPVTLEPEWRSYRRTCHATHQKNLPTLRIALKLPVRCVKFGRFFVANDCVHYLLPLGEAEILRLKMNKSIPISVPISIPRAYPHNVLGNSGGHMLQSLSLSLARSVSVGQPVS